jgi:aspartyl-tRNA(Asn)/glutamyl-tRNA(Gln) amidotransferase subunit C
MIRGPAKAGFPVYSADRRMSLTRTDIENIARLARLELTEAEIPVYVDSLSRIFAFVGELDEVTETDRRDLYQRNAPRVEAGLYLVPKVIE